MSVAHYLDQLCPSPEEIERAWLEDCRASLDANVFAILGVSLRRVILESPYAGDEEARKVHVNYARRCVRDSIHRGESPLASHLLYTQPSILDDGVPEERALGIAAGLAWLATANATVVYVDHGISDGMKKGIRAARRAGIPVEPRRIGRAGGHL